MSVQLAPPPRHVIFPNEPIPLRALGQYSNAFWQSTGVTAQVITTFRDKILRPTMIRENLAEIMKNANILPSLMLHHLDELTSILINSVNDREQKEEDFSGSTTASVSE